MHSGKGSFLQAATQENIVFSSGSACKVAPYEEKLRDPRVANMLKVRAKTLLEYKEASSEQKTVLTSFGALAKGILLSTGSI